MGVEAGAVEDGVESQSQEARVDAEVDLVRATGTSSKHAVQEADQWRAGYRAEGGPPWLRERMLAVVLHCEGSRWPGYRWPHITRAQFAPATWHKITTSGAWSPYTESRHDPIGPLDPDSPYDTGRAVAWWINAIGPEKAGTSAGWPRCFHIETGE